MDFLSLINHIANFFYPAAAVALLMGLFSCFLMKKSTIAIGFIGFVAINFVCNAAVLVGGLVVFGNDGKMATYAAMVLVSAASTWVMGKGWRA